MAFSEFEKKRYEKIIGAYIERKRPPVHIRNEVDLGFRVKGQSVEIFEIRAHWENPENKIEESVAKATYVKTRRIWKILWQRADMKWHKYQPFPEANTLEEFLGVVDADEFSCFYG